MGQWRGGDLALAVPAAPLGLGLSWHLFLPEPGTVGMAGSEESSLVVPLSIQLLVHVGRGCPCKAPEDSSSQDLEGRCSQISYLLCSLPQVPADGPAQCLPSPVPRPAGVPGDGICCLSQITLPGISNRP